MIRNPITYSDAKVRYEYPPPRLGEHGDEIDEWLRGDVSPTYRTGIGTSTPGTITLLGHDLAADLIGKLSFGVLAYWLVAKRRPTSEQLTMFEAVLVALAAGLLGGGSRFLGVTEDAAVFLSDVLAACAARPTTAAEWDELAVGVVAEAKRSGRLLPGLGHPVHKDGDPRTPVLFAVARTTARSAITSPCSKRSARRTLRCSAARFPSTAPVCAARCSPISTCRFPRCAGSPCWPAARAFSVTSRKSRSIRSGSTCT